ncbi:MAG: FecR family protein [Muribaculaceae bacterium]
MIEEKKIENELLIARFLLGECDEEELKALKQRLDESDTFARELFQAEQLFHLGKCNDEDDAKTTQMAEYRLMNTIEQQKPRIIGTRGFKWAMRIAAMLIVASVLAIVGREFFYNHAEPAEELMAITTGDQVKELKLPDGTTVTLNHNTTLKYSRDHFADNRKVYLEGEGHFEVTRNTESPFEVHSTVMAVKVLGTVFDFKSDSLQAKATATLLKGEVEVKGQQGEGLICLSPGQLAHLDAKNRKLVVKQVEEVEEHWYSTTLSFKKSGLRSIAATLERIYGVKVILSPELDLQKTYTGTVPKKETVEEVLDLMQNAMPIKYKVVGNSVFITK